MAHGPAFIALVNDAKSRIRQFTIEEYVQRVKDGEHWILIDIREDHEWQRERMPGALHVGRGILERDVESQFAKDAPLLLQCGGGFRSALSADALQQMGYTNVVSLDGGIRRWKALGLPTEK